VAGAEAIASLINAAFLVERFFLEGDRITVEEVRLRMESGKFILVEEGEALVGCVYVEPRGERAYLGLLSVEPGRQRSGIGRRLMAAAESYCSEIRCRFVDLCIVNLREELPGYYRGLGYVETGKSAFPDEQRVKVACHFVHMSKEL
jgi:GNAT superfamily N-acetyltransferase